VLEFREATEGFEAVAIWTRWQPHLLLIDMALPGLSGEAVTRQIKDHMQARPDAVKTVFIASSGSHMGGECENIPVCGCDEFIRKPFRAEELFSILQRSAGLRLIHGPKRLDPPAALTEQGLACHLAQCKAGWREGLRGALDCGDFNKVSILVGQIRDEDPALHAVLAKWAYACDHEAMIRVLEGACL
jgi:CheY-like chemotaxis protein